MKTKAGTIAKGKAIGLQPKDRKMAVKRQNGKLTGNQWQNTPQQTMFMEHWLDPRSETFGNAYKSALIAGYAPQYANQLASPAINNKWIQEYTKKLNLTEEHIKQGIQQLAIRANDSRSPDDTRLKAYETLARISGMIDNKGSTTVNIVQPILSGASVKVSESVTVDNEILSNDKDSTEHSDKHINTLQDSTHIYIDE